MTRFIIASGTLVACAVIGLLWEFLLQPSAVHANAPIRNPTIPMPPGLFSTPMSQFAPAEGPSRLTDAQVLGIVMDRYPTVRNAHDYNATFGLLSKKTLIPPAFPPIIDPKTGSKIQVPVVS